MRWLRGRNRGLVQVLLDPAAAASKFDEHQVHSSPSFLMVQSLALVASIFFVSFDGGFSIFQLCSFLCRLLFGETC
jgi:hypothetical protein